MSNFIYLDIETLPSQDEAVLASLVNSVRVPVLETEFSPPANYKDEAKIAAWLADKAAKAEADHAGAMLNYRAAVDAVVAKTSFDGGLGHVCCIGWAARLRPATSLIIDNIKDEADLMRESFDAIEKERIRRNAVVLVGHNIVEFDIRFLWQRAMCLGVVMPSWIPRDPKPWSNEVHDTMTMWAGSRDRISMDRLCSIFGLEGKGDGINGAEVAGRWAAGDYEKIAEYCADDVERTRRMHRKMLIPMGIVPDDREDDEKPNPAPIDDELRF